MSGSEQAVREVVSDGAGFPVDAGMVRGIGYCMPAARL